LPDRCVCHATLYAVVCAISQEIDDRSLINAHVVRVEVRPEQLVIQLVELIGIDRQEARVDGPLHVSWQKAISTRRREILLPDGISPQQARPIRSEIRATGRIDRPWPPLAQRTCWAAGNAGMLAEWQPPPEATRIIIFGDNDPNYTGQAAAYALARRLGWRTSTGKKNPRRRKIRPPALLRGEQKTTLSSASAAPRLRRAKPAEVLCAVRAAVTRRGRSRNAGSTVPSPRTRTPSSIEPACPRNRPATAAHPPPSS
jgi:hypothetical protein